MLISSLDCLNWELVSNAESIEHANDKLTQAIIEFSSPEDEKYSSLIPTYTNVVLERKTGLVTINAKAMITRS